MVRLQLGCISFSANMNANYDHLAVKPTHLAQHDLNVSRVSSIGGIIRGPILLAPSHAVQCPRLFESAD